MNKNNYRTLRACCILLFVINMALFLKTKDNGFWVGLYFMTALCAKITELVLWVSEPDK